jgi:hypothetical protein
MSAIAITQLPVPGTTETNIQVLRVYKKTGKINFSFLNQGERQMDGFAKTGNDLKFRFYESNAGATLGTVAFTAAADADAGGAGTIARLTVADSSLFAVGQSITISGSTSYNGRHNVVAVPNGTAVDIASDYVANETGSIKITDWVEITKGSDDVSVPVTVKPGGQENGEILTQKNLLLITGQGVGGGGYCRVDFQFNGLAFFGQIDLAVTEPNKSGFGYEGGTQAGVAPFARDTAWPEAQ